MNTAELKALADQCICHPASRGIADIEAAGEGLKHLISQLEDAQGEIRRLAQVERELEAINASIGEPVAWIRGSGMTMLKLENGGVATVFASQDMSNYSTPLYAIKEVK